MHLQVFLNKSDAYWSSSIKPKCNNWLFPLIIPMFCCKAKLFIHENMATKTSLHGLHDQNGLVYLLLANEYDEVAEKVTSLK